MMAKSSRNCIATGTVSAAAGLACIVLALEENKGFLLKGTQRITSYIPSLGHAADC